MTGKNDLRGIEDIIRGWASTYDDATGDRTYTSQRWGGGVPDTVLLPLQGYCAVNYGATVRVKSWSAEGRVWYRVILTLPGHREHVHSTEVHADCPSHNALMIATAVCMAITLFVVMFLFGHLFGDYLQDRAIMDTIIDCPALQDVSPAMEHADEESTTTVGTFTAYTAAADETGDGDGITASGVKVAENRTLACPPQYAFGTKVAIDGIGTYVCEDRGGAIKDNRFDIYMKTKGEAFAFGRKTLAYTVL